MNQIVPLPIWLGHAADGRNVQQMAAAQIEAVVQLALEEPAYLLARETIYCRFPLIDGTGNPPALLVIAVKILAALFENRTRTLICCGAGRSRSPAIAAAALAMCRNELPNDWLKRVTEQHPTDVSPGLWRDIVAAM